LEWLFINKPPPETDQPLLLKFAFDGGTMTSGKRIQQEIGTVELIIDGEDIAEIKSCNHCHQWIIYIAEEEREIRCLLST